MARADNEFAVSKLRLRRDLYFSIAHWLWGYDENGMPYGPPNRRATDRLAMCIYDRGIRIQHLLDGRCLHCGAPRTRST